MERSVLTAGLPLVALPFLVAVACSALGDDAGNTGGNGSGGTTFTTGTGDPNGPIRTCEEAAAARAYIGCDFWPTVTANGVWSLFDFAVVVANAGEEPADVIVTRGATEVAKESIPPNELRTIYLPWVAQLKGPDADECLLTTPPTATVKVPDGAYHLVSTLPVTVYQFSPLEYAPQGGPPGKSWTACPAPQCTSTVACLSYSNDASLLLPSTAMTGNYRVTGYPGWQDVGFGPFLSITGTQDGTNVTVKLSGKGDIVQGGGISAAGANGEVSFSLLAGEVVQLIGDSVSDYSGSLVVADKPVQVISGMPCTNIPEDVPYCDHVEESVFPAETLGRHYFITVPTAPGGAPIGHVVRLYGNVTGTALTYPGGAPPGAPGTIDAGEVVDLGQVGQDFEIVGDHEFGAATFQLGSAIVDAVNGAGDPAQSLATAVEQYRLKYIFLAPADYEVNYVDIVQPLTAEVTLDGGPVKDPVTPVSSGYGVARVRLGPGNAGAHVLTSTEPVGIQVLGYGQATSYQYPGGLNLSTIAPPPEDVN